MGRAHPARPKQDQVANKFFRHPNANIFALALRNPVELILAVSSFRAVGLLEKILGLRAAFLERNCAWPPWLLYRSDERAELHGPLADVPLSKKPSDYFLRQCFISVDPDEYLVSDVIRRIGDDNLVISTAYPHIDPQFPHALDEFLALDGVSSGSKKKFSGTIARGCTRRRDHCVSPVRKSVARVTALPAKASGGLSTCY